MNEITSLHKSNLITQSNKLVESRYSLSVSEQRIIFAMTSMINPDDEDFREYVIKVSTLAKIIGLKDKDFYSKIQKITKDIIKKTLQIQQEDGILQVNWISSAKYIDDKGIVKLTFDPKLKPYLLQLKKNYTSTKFGITAKFRSFYTTRIYLLLKQYQKIGTRTISVDFFRDLFPQYTDYKDIKKRIIIPAQNEICKSSDITFSFKEIKIGRKVNEIVFFNIKSQSYALDLPLYPPAIKKEDSLAVNINRKYGVDKKVAERLAEEILNENENTNIDSIFAFIDSSVMKGNIKNLPGYVVKCLENRYYKDVTASGNKNSKIKNASSEVKENKVVSYNNEDELWKKSIIQLQKDFESDIYEKWICKLNFIEKKNQRIVLGVDSKFLRDWISKEYGEKIKMSLDLLSEDISEVKFISITE